MRKTFPIVILLLLFSLLAMVVWVSNHLNFKPPPKRKPSSPLSKSQPAAPTASEALLEGYGDPATPPIEDLRKLQLVATGYFSAIQDAPRFQIGGNEDFSAALRGENMNREVFVRPTHRVFSPAGLLVDRWGSPVIVDPHASRELQFRSAGPDLIPHNADDLLLPPAGQSEGVK